MNDDLVLEDDISWFPPIREALLNDWQTKTVIASPDGDTDSLACSLARAVNTNAGHLSIACSLNSETGQIEKLLNTTCFDDDPVLFFRIFLFLLDEFTARLEECYKLFPYKSAPKQPSLISVWTNHYAKHRTAILIQHHAQHLFCDDPQSKMTAERVNAQGNVMLIDTNWLKANPPADPSAANQNRHAVVLVPRLDDFQSAAISYYVGFRNDACSNPKWLEQFQSPHHLNLLNL